MTQWNRIRSLADIPAEIEVQVNYYRASDHADLEKALGNNAKAKLPPPNGKIIRIPKAEFLAYWLFEDKNLDDPLSDGFDTLANSAEDALPDLKRHFEVAGKDLRAKQWPQGGERAGDISTRLGVAIGLCVANKIVSLTRADWQKIDKTYKDGVEESRLDYNLSATPVGFVAVENKGSISKDNSKKSPGVNKHKDGIIRKKKDHRNGRGTGVLLGTIVVADSTEGSKLRCWLLDPPHLFPDDISPTDFRISSRLRFQSGLVQVVFPRSPALHSAIWHRSQNVAEVGAQPFEGQALRYVSGSLIKLKWEEKRKPRVEGKNGLWVGRLAILKSGEVLFMGLNQKWTEAVLRQDLEFLSAYEGLSASSEAVLEWDATREEITMLGDINFRRSGIAGNARFPVSIPVNLNETSGGFAFALIEPKNQMKSIPTKDR